MVFMTYLRVLVDNDGFSYGSPRAWSTPDSATARQAFAQALFEQLPGLALVTLCWVEAHWPSTTYRRVDATMPGSGAVRTFCVPDEHTGQSLGSLRIKDLHTVRMRECISLITTPGCSCVSSLHVKRCARVLIACSCLSPSTSIKMQCRPRSHPTVCDTTDWVSMLST
jgi:hypothetical protein